MKKSFTLSVLFLGLLFLSCNKPNPENNLFVIVKYKTQPNKSVDAITGLKKLIDEVKKEDHFVSLKVHVDHIDNSNILLYEEWDDESYYKTKHMETDHIREFMETSSSYLAGPPEISFWKLNSKYD